MFRFYRQMGLLPGPVKIERHNGRGSTAYYSEDILCIWNVIKKLREEGLSLKQIREYFQKEPFVEEKMFIEKEGPIPIGEAFEKLQTEFGDKKILAIHWERQKGRKEGEEVANVKFFLRPEEQRGK